MSQGVVSLWSLVEACRAGCEAEQQQAAAQAAVALRVHGEQSDSLTIEVMDSLLVVDGFPVVGCADTFAANQGLLGFLRDAHIDCAQFAKDVCAESLLIWARHVAQSTAPARGPAGIATRVRCEPVAADVVRPQPRSRPDVEEPDSQLRSVFLQHQLIAGLPAIVGVHATAAKLVIQGVVDRLLAVTGGLEPLMLLQQDEALLRRSTAVAVLTVVLARRAGWPSEQLADLGAAGLLHDLGSLLDPEAPAQAACQWLLERGDEDFWLRSALVARRWRDGAQATADQFGPLTVIALVRLAAAVHDRGVSGLALPGDGSVPTELMQLAQAALSPV